MKIKRDAFIYLEGDDSKFAQCGSCRFGFSHCSIMNGTEVSAKDGSCAFYIKGKALDGILAPLANLTKKQTGYVERQVRCENCTHFIRGSTCNLFATLNRELPHHFDLDENVSPTGCCNAQTPRRS